VISGQSGEIGRATWTCTAPAGTPSGTSRSRSRCCSLLTSRWQLQWWPAD